MMSAEKLYGYAIANLNDAQIATLVRTEGRVLLLNSDGDVHRQDQSNSPSLGPHGLERIPSDPADVILDASYRLNLVLSLLGAVKDLNLETLNLLDLELELGEGLREVADRLREVADRGVLGGLLGSTRFTAGQKQPVEARINIHGESPSVGDSGFGSPVVSGPSVGVVAEATPPSDSPAVETSGGAS